MVTIIDAKFQHYSDSGVAVNTYTIAGVSTDNKPTAEDVGNGSVFIEMDTSNLHFFDEAAQMWRLWEG